MAGQKTGRQLDAELGRAEAIGHFVAECETAINALSPDLDYRRADLDGFVRGGWPCDGDPADVAAEFVNSLGEEATEIAPGFYEAKDGTVIREG